ncbi:hypothetical protein [Streptomyces sp. NPDC060035]|uniref:hypothetical protein n=1 Tax=Streptomyces sp. NPDC060035 TaxID=3347044 RepID=UPI0036B0DA3D
MARHALSKPRRRALLRAGLTLTALGAALGAGGAAAQAASLPAAPATGADNTLGAAGDAAAPALNSALGYGLAGAVSPATDLQLDPLAGTGVDPLDNGVGTQVADFKPMTTAAATGPLAGGASLGDLPVAGQAAGTIAG